MIRTNAVLPTSLSIFLLVAFLGSCSGAQQQNAALETRPLEEPKAIDIIGAVLKERGYTAMAGSKIELSTKAVFECDFRVNDTRMVIEYLTAQDSTNIGAIPPMAPGSRLHVVPAKTVPDDPSEQGEPVYVYFIKSSKYVYQFNPTSENRADVTFLEVEARMRRDLTDFITWYETAKAKEQ